MRSKSFTVCFLMMTTFFIKAEAAIKNTTKPIETENIEIAVPRSELRIQDDTNKIKKITFENYYEFSLGSINMNQISSPAFSNGTAGVNTLGPEYGLFSNHKFENNFSRRLGLAYQKMDRHFKSAMNSEFALGGLQNGRLLTFNLGVEKDFASNLNLNYLHPMIGFFIKPIWLSMDESVLSRSFSQWGYELAPAATVSVDVHLPENKILRVGLRAEVFTGRLENTNINGWNSALLFQTDWGIL